MEIHEAASRDRDRERVERIIGDRYKILEPIGHGVMSSVFRAWELPLQRCVAIKVLAPDFERQLEDRERFRREARIAAKLTHPHIVPVYAFDQRDGLTYLVMPYVAGDTLARYLEREGTLDAATVRRVLADLAAALHYVHAHGVIHRDVKPSNVLLEAATRRPMLTDFGVATLTTSEHSRSEVSKRFGTPHYMSPEQALGEQECDGRSDLYALGVLGFQLLTGRLPFNGRSPREVAAQHVAIDPPPIHDIVPDVPSELVRIIARCLAKEPRNRWKDGRSLYLALRESVPRSRRWHPRTLVRRLRRALGGNRSCPTESGAWAHGETPTLA